MKKHEHEEILRKIKEEGKKLYEEGKSVREIAEYFKCSFTKVRITLVSMGVKMRPFSSIGLHNGRGIPKTEEHRRRISDSKKGKKLSPEHRNKVVKTLVYGQKGESNPAWKGGFFKRNDGYVYILNREHPMAHSNGYIKRAILVAEEKIGRMLTGGEVTHHINGIKDDDRPENIEILSSREHNVITAKERWARGDFNKILPQMRNKGV